MSAYVDRALAALGQFTGRLSVFADEVASTQPDPPRLPRRTLDDLAASAGRARTAADAIVRSLSLIDLTALDVVDMQVRLQGETARLASALRGLGDIVERQHFVSVRFGDALIALEEAALTVSARVFPSGVRGLREVNVALWDFEKIQWKRYTDVLTDVVARGSISTDEQVRIQAIADDIAQAFGEVNTLLNDLGESRATEASALRGRLERAPDRLTTALDRAETRLKARGGALAPFAPLVRESKRIAASVAKLLKNVTIPVFPPHDRLGTCCEVITPDAYDDLSGVQAFALLNILSRLQATRAAGRPLVEGRALRIMKAFPDRIYFEADASLIADIATDERTFEPAPAALHRFKEGSFKQRTYRKGNLQVSYATRPEGRVVVDADIDLYRGPIPHLFGEVLVNHLTGSTTDQYEVRKILDAQSVPPVGGFHLLRV